MVPALRRPPCVVPFSGGRDSSAVLAVATQVARRDGLPLPLPVTVRFPQASRTDETVWQELVIAHLELPDWERMELGTANGEFDLVGPLAARGLVRHGLLWPANAHFHVPLLEGASGGSLLSGIDGDALFGGWSWPRIGAVLARRVPPEPRDLLRFGYAAAPRVVRSWVVRRRGQLPGAASWLRPRARVAYDRAATRQQSPLRWSAHVATLAGARYLEVTCTSLQALADDTGTLVVHPFLDRRFLAALASTGGAWGWGGRALTTAALFGELLPEKTVTRSSKALFDEVFWSEPSRQFARHWDGTGVHDELVDPDALKREWLSATPHAGSGTLLQAAWLHAQRSMVAGNDSERRRGGHDG